MKLRYRLALIIIISLCIATTNYSAASQNFNLTGRWRCNDGGIYYLRQVGNELWWYGQSNDNDPEFSNVYHATIHGNATIVGRWADVPVGGTGGSGELDLKIVSNNRLTAIRRTGNFGGTEWTRAGAGSDTGRPRARSFIGEWTGNYRNSKGERGTGTIIFRQETDGRITGIEDGVNMGYISVQGNVLTWRYRHNDCREYEGRFVIAADGKTATGSYGAIGCNENFSGEYTLYRKQM